MVLHFEVNGFIHPFTRSISSFENAFTFIGFKVVDRNFGEVGIIVKINETAAQPLFEIDREGTVILIPMVDEFIKKVDRENKKIEVQTPEGLIELYVS